MKKGLLFIVTALMVTSLLFSACTGSAISQPPKPAESKPTAETKAAEAKPAEKAAAPKPAEAKPAAAPAAKPAEKPAEKAALPAAVTIKAVAFLPTNHPVTAYAKVFVDRVNEQGKAVNLKIDYVGGPEVIPPLEQVDALRKGTVVQMTFSPSAYYANMAPEMDVLGVSEITPWDERKPGGLYDFMVERHQKIGVFYLGRWTANMPFHLFTKKKAETPQQLSGQKMRTTALYDPFMKALGIAPITMGPGDVYTSLERGVIDGVGWPNLGLVDLGWQKLLKYWVEPSFYSQNTTILFNQDFWNKLAKPQQDLLKDIAIKLEPDMAKHFSDVTAKEREEWVKAGMAPIKFSAADEKYYIDLAYKTQWDEIAGKVKDPALVTKLRELVKKK